MRYSIVLVAILLSSTLASASTWRMDPEKSRVRFKMDHLITTVEGEFRSFRGVIKLHDKDITKSKVTVSIDTASVKTDTLDFAEELRSDRFFNVARYPSMTFVSKKIVKNGPGELKVTGDLTLHGVTRKVVLDVKGPGAVTRDASGKMRRQASATTRINRKDFGLTWNKLLTTGMGDDIDINIELELVRQ